MPLINCEVNLILTCSSTCVITNSTGAARLTITDRRLCFPVVTLSIQDNPNFFSAIKIWFQKSN